MTNQEIRAEVIRIERRVALFIDGEIEKLEKRAGDRLAKEILASIACLFASRACVILHIWTGEAIDKCRARIFGTFDDDVKGGLKAYARALSKKASE